MTAALLPAILPTAKDVRDLFEGLFGKDVTVSPGEPVSLNDKPAVAVYVDPTLAATALVLVDLPLGAWLAGALALLPKGGLEDAIDEGKLSPMHLEALYEVVNIAASMFNAPGAEHLKLHQLHAAGTPLPPMVRAQSLTLGRREDVSLEIAGYGKGQLSVVMVA